MHDEPKHPLAELRQGQVWGLAHRLIEDLAGKTRVLLLSEQRDLVAAACLAALAGDFELVLPHGLSRAALDQLPEEMPCDCGLLGDEEASLDLPLLRLETRKAKEAASPPLIEDDGRLAVTLFTGGSTARPRAWPKSAQLLLGEARFLAEHFGIGATDYLVSCVGPMHIYGLLFGVLVPLLSGAKVEPKTAFLPAEIQKACPPGTMLVAAPPHFRALVRGQTRLAGLRLAISSAGMLPKEDSEGFTALTKTPLCELYGSTETGGLATRWRNRKERDWTPLPIADLKLEGERLAADSPFLSPTLARNAAGFFVTGDRARWTEGGRFALLGRADGVVKVGGKRVDLTELERVLLAIPGIDDCWVLSGPSKDAHENQIVAVLCGADPPGRDQIRKILGHRFEAVALPRRFLYIKHMPVSTAGKRDRQAIEDLLREQA
ncbi:MAG: AMP-binding protein [Deltaproteobacteria bacterium]|nr:AMP-binding protein [Deltaproteobacteria bacterium]